MSEDEQRWVEAARRGDRDAFRHLVEAHARPLFALASRITRDAALAEDAVQEALLNAFRHLGEFDGRAAFGTWLHRITLNAALEQLRRRGRFESELGDGAADEEFLAQCADEQASPRRRAEGAAIRSAIAAELTRLSALERSAFVLRHVEGHSLEHIAQALSLSVSASKQAIFRAVRKLRGALQPLR